MLSAGLFKYTENSLLESNYDDSNEYWQALEIQMVNEIGRLSLIIQKL